MLFEGPLVALIALLIRAIKFVMIVFSSQSYRQSMYKSLIHILLYYFDPIFVSQTHFSSVAYLVPLVCHATSKPRPMLFEGPAAVAYIHIHSDWLLCLTYCTCL